MQRFGIHAPCNDVYDFSMKSRTAENSRVLYLIAIFKLVKTLVLFAIGIGALKLLHAGADDEIYRWANAFRVDPENRYLQLLLARSSMLNEKTFKVLSVGTFFYSALFFTEGIGLLLRKRWAEYFTIIVTSSFMPLEIYELIRQASFAKETILLLNVAVIVYLAVDLRRRHR